MTKGKQPINTKELMTWLKLANVIGGTDLKTERGGLEFVEGANTETGGGPELVFGRSFGDIEERVV